MDVVRNGIHKYKSYMVKYGQTQSHCLSVLLWFFISLFWPMNTASASVFNNYNIYLGVYSLKVVKPSHQNESIYFKTYMCDNSSITLTKVCGPYVNPVNVLQ